MRNASLSVLLVITLVSATSSIARTEPGAAGVLTKRLWDAGAGELATVFVPWLNNPTFNVRSDAPELKWTGEGYPQFAKLSVQDYMWWIIDESGFRTILELEMLPDEGKVWKHNEPYHGFVYRTDESGAAWRRELALYKQKGDTNYDERRIFRVYRSAPQSTLLFAARLQVWDSPAGRTVGELLEHLKNRYGTFDSLCTRIADHLASRK